MILPANYCLQSGITIINPARQTKSFVLCDNLGASQAKAHDKIYHDPADEYLRTPNFHANIHGMINNDPSSGIKAYSQPLPSIFPSKY